MSQREYARLRGISHVAVQRAVKSGRISTSHGKIDPDLADREWEENTDQSKPLNRITGRPGRKRIHDQVSEPMDLGDSAQSIGTGGGATGYARARAARELFQAQLTKMQLDRQRGLLVSADEVRVGAFSMARKARDQLIALPDRLAAIMAATEDAAEARQILEDEVERICQEITDADGPERS